MEKGRRDDDPASRVTITASSGRPNVWDTSSCTSVPLLAPALIQPGGSSIHSFIIIIILHTILLTHF